MKTKVKPIAPPVLLEQYRQLLQEDPRAENLPLLISGGSMTPFLIGGRDTVFLSRAEGPLVPGDIALYRRDDGGYVLHRVYRVTAAGYTMLGDAQQVSEPGIRPEQIIARVSAVRRKGRLLGPGDPMWEFFCRIWPRLRPCRRLLHRCYSIITAPFCVNSR